MRFLSILLRNKYVIIHKPIKITKVRIINMHIIIDLKEKNYYFNFIMSRKYQYKCLKIFKYLLFSNYKYKLQQKTKLISPTTGFP